jgi:hypothetical protein
MTPKCVLAGRMMNSCSFLSIEEMEQERKKWVSISVWRERERERRGGNLACDFLSLALLNSHFLQTPLFRNIRLSRSLRLTFLFGRHAVDSRCCSESGDLGGDVRGAIFGSDYVFLGATLERLHYSRCSLQESTFNVQYFHDFTIPKHWTARAARVDHQRLDGVEWSMGALVLVVLLRGGAIVGNGFILVVDV